ncbi:Crp/Fnr family transcriptional regulator [Chryseobacterium sp. C-71]|uniref:Crp/Fnr family transcriptional regulator n=1 Tax=Chryseobacterium sp. C-71 TaxID=2893882 RepID=UPI001E488AA8|nr:Crp/Fnr family transcriptional regulator [Chryseobacterium sp. C-71]UFH30717.1 Crp/Fnr family transcriptional regulator [Chryseobacterium sp. C-71]
MNTDIILKNIARHISLTKKEEAYFISLLTEKKLKPKQYLVKEGETSRYLTFINSGCCRAFTIDQNGFEHILYFASQDYWLADTYSFLSQKTGLLDIQTMEETDCLQISKKNLDLLYLKVPKFERLFRILTENAYIEGQNRVLEGLSLSADKRYDIFKRKYSKIKHLLPQKQIALYLGVTPEFFSKMKKKK